MIRSRRRLVLVAALTVGAAGAVLVPTLGAVAANSPGAGLQIHPGKTVLEARGAAVSETLHYVCPAGAQDYLQVQLTERIGRSVTNGDAFAQNVGCTGKPRSITVYLPAQSKAWRKGTAFNQASLTDPFGTGITDARTVTLS